MIHNLLVSLTTSNDFITGQFALISSNNTIVTIIWDGRVYMSLTSFINGIIDFLESYGMKRSHYTLINKLATFGVVIFKLGIGRSRIANHFSNVYMYCPLFIAKEP